MKRRSFYTMALWFPLTYPVVISLGEAFLHDFTWHQMSRLSGLIILAGFCGDIQYLFFAAVLSYWFSQKNMRAIERAIWFLPLAFAVVCSAGLWCFFTFMSMHASQMQVRTSEADPLNTFTVSSNIALVTLMIGYGYLLVLQLFVYLLDRFDFFED